MDRDNRPKSREKNVTGAGNGVHRRGEGLGTGPVGGRSGSGFGQNGQQQQQRDTRSSGTQRSRGGFPILLVVILAILFFGGGRLGGLFGLSAGPDVGSGYSSLSPGTGSAGSQSGSSSSSSGASSYGDLLPGINGLFSGTGGTSSVPSGSSGWALSANNGSLNRSVDPAARDKFTQLRGGGRDQVTVMIYLCGTDLESRSAMATKDINEMLSATISDKVNVLLFTGGCTQWRNSVISSSVNQIYQVKSGNLQLLESNAGTGSMTDPKTLLSFLQYGSKNFPANRYELILWDHGGGSLSGYGYDQKNPNSGSMTLAALDSALSSAGLKFDFIGFDACLMATVENAAMLSRYADYMIASEETEPGIGWYYTDWLTELSANPSMDTLDIGKRIADDFVSACAQQCRGQATTLSVVDLAELSATLPDDLSAFSQELKRMITEGEYKAVSTARSGSREFATSSAIDQIDFVDFARRLDSSESQSLVEALMSAVKYNRTSSSMTNAYGLSVYFPFKKMSNVNKAIQTYDALGMDADYTSCIREFASLELSGQAVSGNTSGYATSPYSALFGSMPGSSSGYGSASSSSPSAGDISGLLSALLGGDMSGLSGLSQQDLGFFTGRSLEEVRAASDYLALNCFDPSVLCWQQNARGEYLLSLSDEQWDLIQNVDLNLYYDDGQGYVNLGLDNIFRFDDEGNLVADTEGTWLSINGQPVAYYHLSTVQDGDSYTITGRVPALLNGETVNLILLFTDSQPSGYVAGAQPVYEDWETETVARGLIELEDGDKLDFLCDYYSYDGTYLDSYLLGETMTVNGALTVHDSYLGDGGLLVMYRFTDLYNQHFWTEAISLR